MYIETVELISMIHFLLVYMYISLISSLGTWVSE